MQKSEQRIMQTLIKAHQMYKVIGSISISTASIIFVRSFEPKWIFVGRHFKVFFSDLPFNPPIASQQLSSVRFGRNAPRARRGNLFI